MQVTYELSRLYFYIKKMYIGTYVYMYVYMCICIYLYKSTTKEKQAMNLGEIARSEYKCGVGGMKGKDEGYMIIF